MAPRDLVRSRRLRFLALYSILLAASYLWRSFNSPAPPATLAALHAAIVDPTAAKPIDIAFMDSGEPGDPRPTIVGIHGSPGSSLDFREIIAHADAQLRWLIVDLPGFGASERELSDFSYESHSAHLEALLDARGIERAHLLAFSMGGGPALRLYERDSTRVASLVLLASIGVQELELLGDYDLNHALHALQLAGLWGLHRATPHFGLLDGAMLDLACARNFFDSDQRPLRGILEGFERPLLILHGERDPLVPYAAALEHRRIVPQSELRSFPEGHFLPWQRGEELARICVEWALRVERGEALARADALSERVESARIPFEQLRQPRAGGIAWFLLLALLVAGTFIAEDLSCLSAGILVAQGRLSWIAATSACAGGIFFGDLLLYAAGRWLGAPLFSRWPLRWFVSRRSLLHAEHWFARRGMAVIFITRFIPGTRLPAYVAAGILRTPFWKFAGYFLGAVLLWTPAVVTLSAMLGREALLKLQTVRYAGSLLLLLFALSFFLLLRVLLPLASARGRRIWRGRWRRLRRWEFWPAWLLYLLLLPHFLRLSWRHGGFHTATAVNPGIETGGLLGESKTQILEAMGPDRPELISHAFLPEGESVAERLERLDRAGLSLPLVLKPDVGERGRGVEICREQEELSARLRDDAEALLAQEFVAGPEFGVFVARDPRRSGVRIISVTRKLLPSVSGDGESTVEELILGDDRALCMARFYLDQLEEILDEVPPPGERVQLAELGTHCRGAIFLDGGDLETPELLAAMEAILESYPGFNFGRFDLKAPSEADLRAGQNLEILELNGLSSEATHIYDAKYGLSDALATLREQWTLAFEIAAAQRARGTRPTPALSLAGRALRHWFRASS